MPEYKDISLEELQAQRPDLLAEYADRLDEGEPGGEGSEGASGEPESKPEGGEMPANILEVIESAVTKVTEKLTGHFEGELAKRDKKSNRAVLESTLAAATDLKDASKDEIRKEFADAIFPDEVEEGKVVREGHDIFRAKVDEAIEAKRAEIKSYLDEIRRTHITGLGAGSSNVAESGSGFADGDVSVNDVIHKRLGLGTSNGTTPVAEGKNEGGEGEPSAQ